MLKFALRNLLSRPLRSLLSMLGLTVAIAGMVGLFSVARGIDSLISQTFNDIPGLVAMQPGAPIPLFSRLPADWGRDIAAVPGVAVVNGEIWQRANLIDGKTIISPPRFLFGVDIPSRLALKKCVYRDSMLGDGPYVGRFLTEADRGTLNAVVSRQIAEEFGKGPGDTLRVNNRDMTIVGVYHHGSLLVDVAIILDIDAVREISLFDPDSVSSFYVEPEEGVDADELAGRIRDVFRGRQIERWQPPAALDLGTGGSGNPLIDFFRQLDRSLKSGKVESPESRDESGKVESPESRVESGKVEGLESSVESRTVGEESGPRLSTLDPRLSDADLPIEVESASQMSEKFNDIAGDLDIILGVLTAIGVSVAVLSIVNTMLMSVTERIIEFGILKANGWSKYDVLKLITIESAVLGLAGGVLGSACGRLAADVINWTWPTRAHLYASPGLLAFGVVFATALGILGGLYPALWAMRMMPMDAIRRG